MVVTFLACSYRLFDSSEDPVESSEEDKPEDSSPQPTGQSYAATVALPSSPPASATLMGTLVPKPKVKPCGIQARKGNYIFVQNIFQADWKSFSDCPHRSNAVIYDGE